MQPFYNALIYSLTLIFNFKSVQHLIDWQDLADADWFKLVERARFHAENPTWTQSAAHKALGMMFFNPSLRTRTSMELAATQLGAYASTLTPGQGTWGFKFGAGPMLSGEAEHIVEAIGVLSRYFDALGVRLFASLTNYEEDKQETKLREIVAASAVPVINLESAFYHPCQALADAAVIHERFKGDVKGKKFVLSWARHPKPLPMAVPNSALLQAARMGMNVTVVRPSTHALDADVMALARSYAEAQGSSVTTSEDMDSAFEGADVVYAKAWGGPLVYQHPEAEAEARTQAKSWTVGEKHMAKTNQAAFMHCLPVRRDVVVETKVLESANAIHLREAQYRLFAQKAILEAVWGLI